MVIKGIMQDLLTKMDPQTDPDTNIEFKERVRTLCSRFLGGAWKTVSYENFKIQKLKGGMSNMLFICSLTDNHPSISSEPDKVLIRVYFNPETEKHLVAESVIFTLLSERHLGPKLYGIFNGGRIEEYIPSRPLKVKELSVSSISNKIARRLALVHCLEVPIWKEPDYIFDALDRWLTQLKKLLPEDTQFNLNNYYTQFGAPTTINFNDLENEIKEIQKYLTKNKSPVVFCHNDLHEGNILLPKTSSGNIRLQSLSDEPANNKNLLNPFNLNDPKLILIDFEYASYNYRGFDFANHFVEYLFDYDIDYPPYYKYMPNCFPSNAHIKEFMINYLKEIQTQLSEAKLNEIATEMIEETQSFIPVVYFFWGVWGLLQVEISPVEFGFAEFGRERLSLYYKHKYLLKE